MKRWMVDIESIGEQPGGVILSIGWVRFSQQGPYLDTAQERRISVQSCLDAGLFVTGETVEWWLDQPGKPWDPKAEAVSIESALVDFGFSVSKADELWAKPPSYDIAAIRHAMRIFRFQPSWSHRSETCLRTLLRMMPATWEPPMRHMDLTHHSAMADAIYQAEVCASALRALSPAPTGDK